MQLFLFCLYIVPPRPPYNMGYSQEILLVPEKPLAIMRGICFKTYIGISLRNIFSALQIALIQDLNLEVHLKSDSAQFLLIISLQKVLT